MNARSSSSSGLATRESRCRQRQQASPSDLRRPGRRRPTVVAIVALLPLLLVLLLFAGPIRADDDIEEEFQKVTCGSAVKLTHEPTGYKLHSHEVSYGSGSGQQSVTAFPESDDPNSLWLIRPPRNDSGVSSCLRGEPIACNAVIRLDHLATSYSLHSHQHRSPLSGQQEVSAFDGADEGDNWQVECKISGATHWKREESVQLLHVVTGKHLRANADRKYGSPIPGQLEVAAGASGSPSVWIAQEGIYIQDRNVN